MDLSVVVGLLLAATVCMLPMYDACEDAALANDLAGLGLSDHGSSGLGPCVLWLAIGAAIVVAVVKLFQQRPGGPVLVLLGIPIAAWMVYSSSATIARTRSNAVDTWETCYHSASGDYGADTYGPTIGRTPHDPFDGPHQAFSDEPCVEESENRTAHRHAHPDGDVADGIHQILYRFPDDRARVIYWPILLLLCLLVSVAASIVAMVRRPPESG